MKLVSSQTYKYEIYVTRKNKLFNLIYKDDKMNSIKTPKIKNINSEEYCRLVGQIYPQLKKLEKTMKHYSLNDSLYFIQLAQKCFENEIVKVEFSNGKIWFTTATQWFYCGNDDYACVLEDKGKSAITEENAKATVVKVTKTGEIQKVYDFIVEGVNVFFVEGIAAEGYSVD